MMSEFDEWANMQEYNIKSIEGIKFSKKPLAHKVKTNLPSLQVPEPIRPRQHSSHLGKLLSNWAPT